MAEYDDLVLLEALTDLYDAMADLLAAATAVVEVQDDPLARLRALHEASTMIMRIRSAFSDAKGAAAVNVHEGGLSYPRIAEALGCSEPYVQQMVYRGRRVGGRRDE